MKRTFLLHFLLFFTIFSCVTKKIYEEKKVNSIPTIYPPKYIFYFIGDGFGISQAHLAEIYLKAKNKEFGIQKLHMNNFPVQTNYTTYAEDRIITGSAASGTALATGKKTSIGTISMNKEHTSPYKTIAEIVKLKGMKVGIITTVSLNHATPAVFYAHSPSRGNYFEIAKQLATSNFDYFAGGGFQLPKSKATSMLGESNDKVDDKQKIILNLLEENGYQYINSKQKFFSLKNPTNKVVAVNPRLSSGKSMPYVIDQNNEDITLQEFTAKGIELLDNPNGFFMMIEGGKIDWACHANDAASTVHEVLQFDEAIKIAVDFYQKHKEETLIIVCADHETGGMAIGTATKKYKIDLHLLDKQNVSGASFSKIFDGYKKSNKDNYKFTDALDLLQKYFGFNTTEKLKLNDCEIDRLKIAYEVTLKGNSKEVIKNDCDFYAEFGSYNPFATEACQILAEKAGIAFTTYSHTAQPVPLRATGNGAELFNGYLDNAEIGQKLIDLLKE